VRGSAGCSAGQRLSRNAGKAAAFRQSSPLTNQGVAHDALNLSFGIATSPNPNLFQELHQRVPGLFGIFFHSPVTGIFRMTTVFVAGDLFIWFPKQDAIGLAYQQHNQLSRQV
jgi:hypothetical protein